MNQIEEIFKSWVAASNPTTEETELATKRHEICLKCEWITNSLLFDTKCGHCGCPISKKIFSPVKGACPIGNWDDIDGAEKINKKQNKTII